MNKNNRNGWTGMIVLKENVLDKDTYLWLRSMVGWHRLSDYQAEMALKNALYTVCAYEDGRPVGMGRIVGDGAVICYVQDLVVVPDAQGKKTGSLILNKLSQYVEGITKEGTTMMMCLMSAKGREGFYEKHDFIPRPTDLLGPGMIRYISK